MERSRNGLVWSGFAITLVSVISYIPLFVRFPSTRDFPWVNLLLFAVGLGMLAAGLKRAYRRPERYRGKVSGTILGVLAVCLVGIFLFGNFVFARRLPASGEAPRVGQTAPAFTLTDADGKSVSLGDMLKANRAVLLIFYRGYW